MKSGGRGGRGDGGGKGSGRGGDGGTVGTPLALAEDAALLPRVEAFTVLFKALCLTALASPPHLRQLQSQIENCGNFLDVFGESSRIASESL